MRRIMRRSEWIDKFAPVRLATSALTAKQTLCQAKELGMSRPPTSLPPVNPIGTPETPRTPASRVPPAA